ncbi:MAG: hypothetical protein ACFFD4_31105 [Candidatus Odinarchaeota archaeon]
MHFWKGYSSEYQLNRKWLTMLPEFFRWRDLTIHSWMVRENNDEKVPDHLKQQLTPCLVEFRDRILNDTQIVDIPRDLAEWFPE